MTTGMHIVRDMFCIGCMYPVGWKYEKAYEESQKYKEGKFILERSKLEVDNSNVVPCDGIEFDTLEFNSSEMESICP